MSQETARYTAAEQVDLYWFTDLRGNYPNNNNFFHGVPLLNGNILVVQTMRPITTTVLVEGIANGSLVVNADFTVLSEMVEFEMVWVMIAMLREKYGARLEWARRTLSAIRTARPGWIKDGFYDIHDGKLWVMLAHGKRFYNWQQNGYFSSTTHHFNSAEEFIGVSLNPKEVDVSDLVSINVTKLCAGLVLRKPVRQRSGRRAVRAAKVAPAAQVLVAPPIKAEQYPTMAAPGQQAPAVAPAQALEPDLPRSDWQPVVEEPIPSNAWAGPNAVQEAIEQAERLASLPREPVYERPIHDPEADAQMLAVAEQSRLAREQREALELGAQPPTFWKP